MLIRSAFKWKTTQIRFSHIDYFPAVFRVNVPSGNNTITETILEETIHFIYNLWNTILTIALEERMCSLVTWPDSHAEMPDSEEDVVGPVKLLDFHADSKPDMGP